MISLYENATHIVVTGEEEEIKTLVEDFEFRPDGYHFAPSYDRWINSGGKQGWDGWLRPLQLLTKTSARALRGHKQQIIDLAKLYKLKVDGRKLLPLVFAEISEEDVRADLIAGDFLLDDRQRLCVYSWMRAGIGVNKVTVSGGKTAMFAGAAAFIKERFPEARIIYISQAERLIRQVTGEMKKFLPHFDVGQFGGGHHDMDAKDMVVCTVAMLNRHFHALRGKKWFDSFMAILYDEVHHACSKTSVKVLDAIPAYFRLGASDSVKEAKIAQNVQIRGLFGPILEKITVAPLIKEERVARPHIYVVDVASWHNKYRHVSHAPELHSRAYVLADGEWMKGRYMGPVYERTEDGELVTKRVRDTVPNALGEFETHEEPVIISGLQLIELDGEKIEVASRWCLLDRTYDRCIVQFKERNQLIVEWAQHFASRDLTSLIVCTRTLHIYILEALIKDAVPDPEKVDILFGHDSVATRNERIAWFKSTPGSILITPLVKEGISINEIQAGVVADYISDREVANQIIGRFIRKKLRGQNRAEIVWFRDRQHPVLRRGSSRVLDQLREYHDYQFYDDPENGVSGPDSIQRLLDL